MIDVSNVPVDAPGVPRMGLRAYLDLGLGLTPWAVEAALGEIAAGRPVIVPGPAGASLFLERRGLYVSGALIAKPDPAREGCLDAIGHRMRGRRLPGGSVDAWLAPLATPAIAEILLTAACRRWPELLFAAVGLARGADRIDPAQDLYAGSRARIVQTEAAEAAMVGWASCLHARFALAAGDSDEALWALRLARRAEDPAWIGARFAARLDALYAQAEALQARQRSDEVA